VAKHWWSRHKDEGIQTSQSLHSERWDERERKLMDGNHKDNAKHEWGYDMGKRAAKKKHWWSR
jgi:hypothetical protein